MRRIIYRICCKVRSRRLVIFSLTRTISQAASLQKGDLFSCRICAAPNLKTCSISAISPIPNFYILFTSRQASTRPIPEPSKASRADKASTAWAWVNSTTPASKATFPSLISLATANAFYRKGKIAVPSFRIPKMKRGLRGASRLFPSSHGRHLLQASRPPLSFSVSLPFWVTIG